MHGVGYRRAERAHSHDRPERRTDDRPHDAPHQAPPPVFARTVRCKPRASGARVEGARSRARSKGCGHSCSIDADVMALTPVVPCGRGTACAIDARRSVILWRSVPDALKEGHDDRSGEAFVKVHLLTIFPELFGGPLATGPIRIAREKRRSTSPIAQPARLHDRQAPRRRRRPVRRRPGHGDEARAARGGDRARRRRGRARGASCSSRAARASTSAHAARARARGALLFVCGRYEGRRRARDAPVVDEELSIGDYVLSGGELAALVVVDAIVRLLPGVLGNEASPVDDSFATGLLEGPQYTRPLEFRGARVPDVLLSGRPRRDRALAARAGAADDARAPSRPARDRARSTTPDRAVPARARLDGSRARWVTSTSRSSIIRSSTRTAPS